MKRATRFPLKPERLTGLPSRAGRVKSGTSEPMRSVSVVMVQLLSGWELRADAVHNCSPLVAGLSNIYWVEGRNCFRRYVKLQS